MLDIIETINNWRSQNRKIALATVVETWGSAPRRVGAKMAVTEDMAMVGSVSGGCVETAVVQEALDSLENGRPRLLNFGVSDDTAWDVGLTCGGKISVFVEPLDADWWQIISEAILQDQYIVSGIVLEGDNAGQKLTTTADFSITYQTVSDETAQKIAHASAEVQQSSRHELAELNVMVDVHQPRPHLILIGGVHVAMPLQSFARQLGFRVSIIDPRQVFATEERFPNVDAILHSYPDKALPQLGLDRGSYLAVLTHDPKIDDPALITALPSAAPYIGVLSSSRTHEKRLGRLRDAGVDESLFSRINTPIGLDIGAQTPEEIALSIMSEVISVRNGKFPV